MTRIADQIRQMKAALARTNEATTKVETLLKEREEDVSQVLEVAQTISMMIQRIGGQGDSVSE